MDRYIVTVIDDGDDDDDDVSVDDWRRTKIYNHIVGDGLLDAATSCIRLETLLYA